MRSSVSRSSRANRVGAAGRFSALAINQTCGVPLPPAHRSFKACVAAEPDRKAALTNLVICATLAGHYQDAGDATRAPIFKDEDTSTHWSIPGVEHVVFVVRGSRILPVVVAVAEWADAFVHVAGFGSDHRPILRRVVQPPVRTMQRVRGGYRSG
jgi:hypothetical protein